MSEREYANIIESYKKTVEQDIRLIDKLKQQRDELLAACSKTCGYVSMCIDANSKAGTVLEEMKAAIANCET